MGKTRQALCCVHDLIQRGKIRNVLILCSPTIAKTSWIPESDKLYEASFRPRPISLIQKSTDDRKKAIIIDCANMEQEPGQIKKFSPDEVKSVKQLAHQSLHEQDLLKIIEIAKQLDQCPEEIVIFGIQPKNIELDQTLSLELTQKIDNYINLICAELN